MRPRLLSGFIIAPRDFSIDNELIGMPGFITTQFGHFCRNCVKTVYVHSAHSFLHSHLKLVMRRNRKRKEDLIF